MAKTASHPAPRAFSLVEMIITSLLVGIIVIGIIPLFVRAVTNNIYGADASQLASFLRSGAERIQQRSANDAAFGTESYTTAADGEAVANENLLSDTNVKRTAPLYYDTGARNSVTKADDKLGDETWTTFDTAAVGVRLWRQRREIREYSVADIFRGNISVGGAGGSALQPLGNPKLFDSPQPYSGRGDITEIRMIVESMRGGITGDIDRPAGTIAGVATTPSGVKQKAVVNVYRAF